MVGEPQRPTQDPRGGAGNTVRAQVWPVPGLSGGRWTGCALRQQTFLVRGGRQWEIYHFLSGNPNLWEVNILPAKDTTSHLPALPAISSAGSVCLGLRTGQRDHLLVPELETEISRAD